MALAYNSDGTLERPVGCRQTEGDGWTNTDIADSV